MYYAWHINEDLLLNCRRLTLNLNLINFICLSVSASLLPILINVNSFFSSLSFNYISLWILEYILLHNCFLEILHYNSSCLFYSLPIWTRCYNNWIDLSFYSLSLRILQRICLCHSNFTWFLYNVNLVPEYISILLLCHLYHVGCCC